MESFDIYLSRNLFAKCKAYFQNVRKRLQEKGLVERLHGNIKKAA